VEEEEKTGTDISLMMKNVPERTWIAAHGRQTLHHKLKKGLRVCGLETTRGHTLIIGMPVGVLKAGSNLTPKSSASIKSDPAGSNWRLL
jgi:hypothetical protein